MVELFSLLWVCLFLFPSIIRGWGGKPNPSTITGQHKVSLKEGGVAPLTDGWWTTSTAASRRQPTGKVQAMMDNFKRNRTVVVNLHVTHHAGTTLCLQLAEQVFKPLPQFGKWMGTKHKVRIYALQAHNHQS
jgi:hypothetical protein